jgi:hypothetical protein
MKLLSSLICEGEKFSLNDLTLLQRVMLKKVYTGRIDAFSPDLSDRQLEVLDSLLDLGLLDSAYEVTPQGSKAAEMLDSYARQEKEDISTAKQIAAAEIKGKNFEDNEDYSDELDDFPFTEGEEIAMKASGLNEKEIAKLFLSESDEEYHGHPSYAHWNAALWVSSNEGLYNLAVKSDRDMFIDIMNGWESPDGVVFDKNLAGYAWDMVTDSKVEEPEDDYDDSYSDVNDYSDDGDALASAGWGTDEDYGYFGDDY